MGRRMMAPTLTGQRSKFRYHDKDTQETASQSRPPFPSDSDGKFDGFPGPRDSTRPNRIRQ